MSKSLRNATLVVTIFSVVTRGIAFVFKIYLSRRVGAEIMGVYQICLSYLLLFVTIAASGIPLTLSRLTATYSVDGRNKDTYSLVSAALLLSMSIIGILLTIYYPLSSKFAFIFQDQRCLKLFKIMLPATLSSVAYIILRSYFMGKKQYAIYSATELTEEIVRVVLMLIFLADITLFRSEELALGYAFLVSDIISFLILFIIYRCKKGVFLKPKGLPMLIKGGAPITLMRIMATLASTLTASILPQRLAAAGYTVSEASGLYGIATGMAMPLILAPIGVIGGLTVVLLPEIAEEGAKKDYACLNLKLDKAIRFAMAISMLFVALYMAFGQEIGYLLYQEQTAGSFLAYGCGMILPLAFTMLLSTTLNSLGYERRCFVHFLIALATMLLGIIILPKYTGIMSLALSETAYYVISMLLNLIFLCKKKVLTLNFYKPMLLTFLCFAFSFSLGKLTYRLFTVFSSNSIALFCSIFILVTSYAISAICLKVVSIKDLLAKFKKGRSSQI